MDQSAAGSPVLPQPEPGLTAQTLIERARAMRDQLRAEQDESEQRGAYSPSIHEQLKAGGLYRITQPRMFGGYEMTLPEFYRIQLEICRGDPGSGWCFGLGGSHAFITGSHWPESAQRELFGLHDGHYICPARPRPAGKLVPENGGYRVNGVWDYCSGAPYSTHFIGGATVEEPGKPPRYVQVAIPREQYRVLPDWGGGATLGMAASGSNSIEAKDAWVPAHFAIEGNPVWADGESMKDGTPGAHLHKNPMYLGRVMGPYHATVTIPVIGAAWAAIDEFEQILLTRPTLQPPFVPRYTHFEHQRPFGEAIAMTRAAEAIVFAMLEQYMELCYRWQRTGQVISPEDNIGLWTLCQQGGKLASEAVELILRTSGSAASKRGSKIQRYFRDTAMYRGHASAQWQNFAVYLARAHFNQPVQMFGL